MPGQVTRLAPPRAAATSTAVTVTSAVTMSAAGGGDRTTLHNAARHSAAVALQAQLATKFGPAAAVAGVKEEVSIDGASGSSPGKKPGRADILFRSGNTAYIWEVKSAGPAGTPYPSPLQAARIAQAAGQVQRYLKYYRIKNPPPVAAQAGPAMAAPVGVFNYPTYQVWSPVKNTLGAILYQQVPKPPKLPVPPPIPVPVKAPQRRTQPRQVRNPVTGPPPIVTPAPLPLPSAREVVEGVLAVAVVVVVVVAFASGVGEAAAAVAAIGAGIASLF